MSSTAISSRFVKDLNASSIAAAVVSEKGDNIGEIRDGDNTRSHFMDFNIPVGTLE